MDEYLGIVKLFAGTFAPRGWAFCDGSLLQISQNTALFSILSTTYGGNGQTTFALPDLRGRVAVGAGSGNGAPAVNPGEVGGSANVSLTNAQMPQHAHALMVSTAAATSNDPTQGVLAKGNWVEQQTGAATEVLSFAATPTGQAPNQSIGIAGGNAPFSVMQPYLGLNYIICVEGIYPPRN